MIFTTSDAKQKNWQDNGHLDKSGAVQQIEGLKTRLNKLSLQASISAIDIPEGKSQPEILEIFQIIFEQLQEGEEVVFDITHGFRSIPLLAIVVLSYRVMKNITIRGIYYGALEAAQAGAAPIFDLIEFDLLLEWTPALGGFIKAGDASLACELASQEVRKKKQGMRRNDPVLEAFNQVTNQLREFSLALATCRGLKISPTVRRLKKALAACQGLTGIRPYMPLLQKFSGELANFPGEPVRDGLAAAQWGADHNLLQQGFTILQETFISHVTVNISGDDLKDIIARQLVNQGLIIFLERIPQEKWAELARQHPEKINLILEALEKQPGMAKVLKNIGNDRNDLNYAGFRPHPMNGHRFAPKLRDYITYFQNIFNR